jgi:hypothetical protein
VKCAPLCRASRGWNGLDESGTVILYVADARADRPADHVVAGIGGEQSLQIFWIGRLLAEPDRPGLGGSTTGIRLWSSAHKAFGFVVAIVKLRMRSLSGERQVSHNPAIAIRRLPLRPMA